MKRLAGARFLVLGALALGVTGCGAKAPPDRATALVQVEGVVGMVLATLYQPASSPYEDEAVRAYVRGVAMRVAGGAHLAGRTWEIEVLDDSDPNAYSLLGGHVYVSRGMLAILDSEAELAAVIAHEMAHVVARHGLNTVSDLEAGARTQDVDEANRSRDKEHQADQLAIRYLAAAGYDPGAFESMLRSLLSFRPGERDRTGEASRIARAAFIAGDAPHGEIGRERYLGSVDGLVLGEDPRYGRLEGGRFIHERMGFSMAIPEGMVAAIAEHGLLAFDAARQSGLVVKPASSFVAATTIRVLEKEAGTRTYTDSGLTVVVGKLDGEWTAVMTTGEKEQRRLIFSAGGHDEAEGRATLLGALAGIRAITPEERRAPRRLRTATVEREGVLRELILVTCGGAARVDPAFSLELHGTAAAERTLHAGDRLKCAPRKSLSTTVLKTQSGWRRE